MGESEGDAWYEDEKRFFDCFLRESNVHNDAFQIIGLYGPGDKIFSLLEELGACEDSAKLPHCLGYVVPGNE